MIVFYRVLSGSTLPRAYRAFRTTTCVQRRKGRQSRITSELEHEIDKNPDFYDEVEHLSNTLVDDTSRSIASDFTKSHSQLRNKVKAAIIYRKNFR